MNDLMTRLEAIEAAARDARECGALGSDVSYAEITLAKEAVLEYMREAADRYCNG